MLRSEATDGYNCNQKKMSSWEWEKTQNKTNYFKQKYLAWLFKALYLQYTFHCY